MSGVVSVCLSQIQHRVVVQQQMRGKQVGLVLADADTVEKAEFAHAVSGGQLSVQRVVPEFVRQHSVHLTAVKFVVNYYDTVLPVIRV